LPLSGNTLQLTSDGFEGYVTAVKKQLRGPVSFAQLVKIYASHRDREQRYSTAEVVERSQLRSWETLIRGAFAPLTLNGRISVSEWEFTLRPGSRIASLKMGGS